MIDKLRTVMNSITLTASTLIDFKAYEKMVCEKDIYTHIGDNLSQPFIDKIKTSNGYEDKVYKQSLGYKTKQRFKDLRSYCKVLVLEYMYCSANSTQKRLDEVKRIYPKAVNKFIYDFKYCKELGADKNRGKKKRTKRVQDKIDKAKKLFAKLLQQTEAYILLDVITKELSELNPEMFIATIHDSIVVPVSYEAEVKAFLQRRLYEILGVEAEIKSEVWGAKEKLDNAA